MTFWIKCSKIEFVTGGKNNSPVQDEAGVQEKFLHGGKINYQNRLVSD